MDVNVNVLVCRVVFQNNFGGARNIEKESKKIITYRFGKGMGGRRDVINCTQRKIIQL